MAFTTPVKTWASGDILTAADLNTYLRDNLQYLYDNRLTKIAESVLGSSAASVTFSSIPATYRHLRITWQARGDTAATNTSLSIQFNADTGANYDQELDDFSGTTVGGAAVEGVGTTSITCGRVAAANAPANVAAQGTIDIPNYAGIVFHKGILGQQGLKYANSTTNIISELTAGFWRSTAAISSIVLKPAAGNFITSSSFQLYGWN